MEERVTGIGGIFFKSRDPKALKAWYERHLGIHCDQYGAKFLWYGSGNPPTAATGQEAATLCSTVWSPMSEDTDYYAPSPHEFMINYRVADLDKLLQVLREEGVEQVGEMQEYEYGKFAWILDPEGRKIELWQPLNESVIIEPPVNHTR